MIKEVSFKGLFPIPGFPDYYLNKYGKVFRYMTSAPYPFLKSIIFYHSEYFLMHPEGSKGNKGERLEVTLDHLKEMVFKGKDFVKPAQARSDIKIVVMNSMNGRAPLTREKTINLILTHMPDVQVPLTRNANGKYETGFGMKEKGIMVCEDCGHIQAVEIKICKNCNQYITQQLTL